MRKRGTHRLTGAGIATLIVAVLAFAGCRFEDSAPAKGSLRYRLMNGSWYFYTEAFAKEGFRIAFLPFEFVVTAGGHVWEWKMADADVLEMQTLPDRRHRYRWFDEAQMFVYCRTGFAKPFFIAPDSLDASRVYRVAAHLKIDECSPTTILRIAGANVEWDTGDGNPVKSIDLTGVNLSRVERAALREIGSIGTLILYNEAVSDVELGYLSGLTLLHNLALGGSTISDRGLSYLTGLPIRQLDISSTRVTDEGIMSLADIPTLEVVYLANTQVTDAGIAWLRSRLPNVAIHT